MRHNVETHGLGYNTKNTRFVVFKPKIGTVLEFFHRFAIAVS